LRESVHGWIDDVIALARPWCVDFSKISGPVLLWHGDDDVFSPASHTRWLHKKIERSELRLPPGVAHFEAITILPEILLSPRSPVSLLPANNDSIFNLGSVN